MQPHNRAWNSPDIQEDSHIAVLGKYLAQLEDNNAESIRRLNDKQEFWIISDYSGDHSDSKAWSISLLLAATDDIYKWKAQIISLREAHNFTREMSYKKLGDRRRAQFLNDFLNCADQLTGNLITVCMPRKIELLFPASEQYNEIKLKWQENLGMTFIWKKGILYKAVAVASYLVYLIAGFSKAGQSAVWVTDNDSIVPNEQALDSIKILIDEVSRQILPHEMDVFRLGRDSDTESWVKNLTAIPDLASGVFTDFSLASPQIDPTNIVIELGDNLPEKARTVLRWLSSTEGANLKKVNVYLDD